MVEASFVPYAFVLLGRPDTVFASGAGDALAAAMVGPFCRCHALPLRGMHLWSPKEKGGAFCYSTLDGCHRSLSPRHASSLELP